MVSGNGCVEMFAESFAAAVDTVEAGVEYAIADAGLGVQDLHSKLWSRQVEEG